MNFTFERVYICWLQTNEKRNTNRSNYSNDKIPKTKFNWIRGNFRVYFECEFGAGQKKCLLNWSHHLSFFIFFCMYSVLSHSTTVYLVVFFSLCLISYDSIKKKKNTNRAVYICSENKKARTFNAYLQSVNFNQFVNLFSINIY